MYIRLFQYVSVCCSVSSKQANMEWRICIGRRISAHRPNVAELVKEHVFEFKASLFIRI